MQRVAQNDLALEGKNDDEGQKQADGGYMIEFGDKLLFKIVQAFVFDHQHPCQNASHKRDHHK